MKKHPRLYGVLRKLNNAKNRVKSYPPVNRFLRSSFAWYLRMKNIIRHFLSTRTSFYFEKFKTEVDPTAIVDPTAWVSPDRVRIGKNCVIGPKAVIFANSIIEDDVIVYPSVVIGSPGFMIHSYSYGSIPFECVGSVRIKRSASIQTGTCIDRGADGGATEIGEQAIIGAYIHIAHDVVIRERCRVMTSSMVAGHVTLGAGSIIGENSSISNRINIGEKCVVLPGSVVTKDMQANTAVGGNFAIDADKFKNFARTLAI